jgi:hypothetical protein
MRLRSRSIDVLAMTNVMRASALSTRRKRSGRDDGIDMEPKVTPAELRRCKTASSRATSAGTDRADTERLVFPGRADTVDVRLFWRWGTTPATTTADPEEIDGIDCAVAAGARRLGTTGDVGTALTATCELLEEAFDAELLGADGVSPACGAGSGAAACADCAGPPEGAGSGEGPAASAADDANTPKRSTATNAISSRTPKAHTVR